MELPTSSNILVIDVGATSIKSAVVNDRGELLSPIRKRKTPRPIGPTELLLLLLERVRLEDPMRVVVGVPVECRAGVVIDCGNLARKGSVSSAVDVALELQWREFPIELEFTNLCGREVRILNDASLAALGCISGSGVELVLALGTGFGVALTKNGILQEVEDYGERKFKERNFDDLLGEEARSRDEVSWKLNLEEATRWLVAEHKAEAVWLVGGNAKRLKVANFENQVVPVSIAGNEAPFRGATSVFNNPLAIGR